MPALVLNYVFFSFLLSKELIMPSLRKCRRTFMGVKGRCTVAPSEYSWKGNKKPHLDVHTVAMLLFAVLLAVCLLFDCVFYSRI